MPCPQVVGIQEGPQNAPKPWGIVIISGGRFLRRKGHLKIYFEGFDSVVGGLETMYKVIKIRRKKNRLESGTLAGSGLADLD
jgi:hypothetical protein